MAASEAGAGEARTGPATGKETSWDRGVPPLTAALLALLALGWGALLSYSAFYLTDDRAPPQRPSERRAGGAEEPGPTVLVSPIRIARDLTGAPAGRFEPMRPPAPELAAVAPPQPAPAPALPVAAAAEALAAAHPAEAVPPEPPPEFVGTWGPNARACGIRSLRHGYLPARITADGAKAGGTTCDFRDRRRSGQAWVVTASCRDGGRRWSSEVRLHVEGPRLTWSSARGISTYVRCARAG